MPEYFKFNHDPAHPNRLLGIPFTEMVRIQAKGKEFIMLDDSNKEVKITFDHDFYLGAYPVTQALYEHVMGENPSSFKGPQRPVERVSWNDIMRKDGFLSKLNLEITKKIHGTFSLPSEAQWLYAAAAGASLNLRTNYAGGNDLNDLAWFKSNCEYSIMPVGLKQPNNFGLYDMNGNVWEWCLDDFKEPTESPKNGKSNINHKDTNKVLHGGSINTLRGSARLTFRYNSDPGIRTSDYGFRICFINT